jgi:predicted amidohydrolase
MDFTLALCQIDPVLGDLEANVRRHVDAARNARAAGAAMAVFPELSLTGYSVKDLNWDLAVGTGKTPKALAPLVEESNSIVIVAGGVEEGPGFGIYNAAFLFEGGSVRTVHRKLYLPTYGMFEEMRYFSRGPDVRAFETRLGRFGVLICEDLWHISLPYLLAMDGAQVIFSLTASPTRLGGDGESPEAAIANTENHRVYARLLSMYVAFCNRVGYEDGVNFWGGSKIVGPDGGVLAEGKLFEEDLVLARVDGNEVRRARRFSRHLLDEDPELVKRELDRIRRESRG